MSFRRTLGLAAVMLSAAAVAQTESSPATVIAAEETAPAAVVELTEAHGTASAGDAAAGESKAAVCAACHSADGNASDPQYPKLAGQHERYIARQLGLYKSGERSNPIMLGFAATLSPQDMRDIGAFFSTKTVVPGMADDTAIAEGPYAGRKYYEVGQSLYRGGDAERGIPACIGCHGPSGRGNPGPAYPSIGGQHSGYTSMQLNAFRDGTVYGRGEKANAIMAGVAKYLTDEEIGALASYVEGLHANPGTAGGK